MMNNWAVIALGGIPNKVQVGDMGVDGRIFPVSSSAAPRKQQAGELGLKPERARWQWWLSAKTGGQRTARPTIPPFEFENWAVIPLGGIPKKVQFADMGIHPQPFQS
jgi:hypothetical protein